MKSVSSPVQNNTSMHSTKLNSSKEPLDDKNPFDNDVLLNRLTVLCDSGVVKEQSLLRKKYEQYLAKVRAAYKTRKIFIIGLRGHATVRKSLQRRGWLEKLPGKNTIPDYDTLIKLLDVATDGNEFERRLISHMLSHYPANFLHMATAREILGMSTPYWYILRSRYSFVSKPGLWRCARNSQWEHPRTVFTPRTHILTEGGIRRFLEDYRLTQCLSLLQFIDNSWDVCDAFGSISTNAIEFAIEQINRMVMIETHVDIEKNIIEMLSPNELEWSKFIQQSKLILRNSFKFKCFREDWPRYLRLTRKALSSAENVSENFHGYGTMNVWILKPTSSSCGWGVRIMLDDAEITEVTRNSDVTYLAQKYIERPMLIYQTKFDIRQYLMLSAHEGFIEVWMYKDCYLKFSSQIYSLINLNRSVHVTNHTVQQYYKNAKRDSRLPQCNMWNLGQFQTYLASIGLNHLWDEKIYPAMREAIISIVQCSSFFETRSNVFNLFGADIMITDNFDVVILEINASPDMSASTNVTGCLCPRVLEDLVKVIVDLPENASASTGEFELILKLPLLPAHKHSADLRVEAKEAKKTDLDVKSKLKRKIIASYPTSTGNDEKGSKAASETFIDKAWDATPHSDSK